MTRPDPFSVFDNILPTLPHFSLPPTPSLLPPPPFLPLFFPPLSSLQSGERLAFQTSRERGWISRTHRSVSLQARPRRPSDRPHSHHSRGPYTRRQDGHPPDPPCRGNSSYSVKLGLFTSQGFSSFQNAVITSELVVRCLPIVNDSRDCLHDQHMGNVRGCPFN